MTNDWQFLPNLADEEDGLGHPGIETFTSAPFSGIARESAQNSLDAALRNAGGNPQPIRLAFRRISVPREEIPGIDSLTVTLEACLERSRRRELKKDIEFFEQACRVVQRQQVHVLLVEDYGTVGLRGPAEQGKPFHALVKATGISQKEFTDAGGSFGIGKFAVFAVSHLRTVFYATLYQSDSGPAFLCQGKSVLVSHETGDENACRGFGYWGRARYQALEDSSGLPDWLRRTEVGTTVASVGLREEEDWEWRMVVTLLRNFFAAVRDGKVSFTVDTGSPDSIEINSATLGALFEHPAVKKAAEAAGNLDELEFAVAMDRVRTSPDAVVHRETFEPVGTFVLRILQETDLPRRVGILRNGMYLTDNLKHFKSKLMRFRLCGDFVAVLEPEDVATSAVVRDLENPRHDELSAERIEDPARRRRVKAAMNKLSEWVRDAIRELAFTPPEEEVLVDELNRFFGAPDKTDRIPDPANEEKDPERIRIKPRVTEPRRPVGEGPEGESGSAGGRKKKGSDTGRTTGDRPGRGRGAAGGRGGRSIPIRHLRTWIPEDHNPRFRTINLEPEGSGMARLEIIAVGATGDAPIELVSLNGHRCARTPSIELSEGERKSLILEFNEAYPGPLRIVLSRVEEAAHADQA